MGCSVEQTHKTLTFFFDGVDQVNLLNKGISKDSLGRDAVAKRDQLLLKNRPDQFVHRPYKEKKCEECHTPDKHLRMPLPDLCFHCHKNFTETNKFVHGPVASGNCLKCHNQHMSRYPKLLIRQGQQLCLYCHNSTQVFVSKVHRDIEDAECTMCHNPHGGANRFMIKDGVIRNFNGKGMAGEFAPRHLSGQVFNKLPGDVGKGKEIIILDEFGNLVSSSYTDDSGRFVMSNLHPDHSYTFKLKEDGQDFKFNITNYKNDLVYVVEKNRKGKYIFDKTAYETAHAELPQPYQPAPGPKFSSLKDSLVAVLKAADTAGSSASSALAANTGKASDSLSNIDSAANAKPKFLTTEELMRDNLFTDSVNKKGTVPNKEASGTKDVVAAGQISAANPLSGTKSAVGSGEPKVKSGAANEVIRQGASRADNENAPLSLSEIAGKYERDGVRLVDLSEVISRYYSGTIVCVLNDSSFLLGIGKVDDKGDFMLNDFLPYYHMKLSEKGKDVSSQTVYLDEQMNLIEIVNQTNREKPQIYLPGNGNDAKVAEIMTEPVEQPVPNAPVDVPASSSASLSLSSSVYFGYRETALTPEDKAELNVVVKKLADLPGSKVYLVGYTDAKNTTRDLVRLAENRVKETIAYLISKGIDPGRIVGQGYAKQSGKKNKKEDPDKNRKVDIYIKTN